MTRVLALLLIMGIAVLAPGVQPGPAGFELPWVTIDGGGGLSSNAQYDLYCTIGQPDAFDEPMASARFDLYGGFWYARVSDTACPDASDNLDVTFGVVLEGDALLLCDSDDQRIRVRNIFAVTPLLPFVRFEIWAHSIIAGDGVTSVHYTIEGHCNAIVGGGQNGDTLRTRIRNYDTGIFELIDVRPTGPFADEIIEHTQVADASSFVRAGDGEVRVRMDAFNPGTVVNAGWEVRIDALEVRVDG